MYLPRLCLLIVLWPILSHAQEGHKVTCRFLCVEGAVPPPPLVNVSAKGEELTCSVPADTISAPVVCFAKGESISFLTASELKPAAIATLPANTTAAILVFAPAQKAPDALPWKISVMEDFSANAADGGALLVNFCTQDVRLSIADTTVTLQSGKAQRLARPEKLDAFNMAAAVFQFQQDDVWRTASESMLRFVPGMRYLIYAYLDPVTGRPRFCTLQDFPPAKIHPSK